MNISQRGIDLIKSYEGCRLTAYVCPGGVWTIGWGHTGNDVYEGQVITQAEADALFLQDIERYVQPVRKYSGLNQNQFDALCSFCYNCGAGALSDIMSGGDVCANMMLYVHGGGEVLPGLVRRRQEEVALYNTIETTLTSKYTILKDGTEIKIKPGAYWGLGKGNPTSGQISEEWLKNLNNSRLKVCHRAINNGSDEYYVGIYSQDFKTLKGTCWIPVNSVNEVIHHVVVSGDTVSELASQYGTTIESICALNPTIGDENIIHVNSILRVR